MTTPAPKAVIDALEQRMSKLGISLLDWLGDYDALVDFINRVYTAGVDTGLSHAAGNGDLSSEDLARIFKD